MSPFLLDCEHPCEFPLKAMPYDGQEFLYVLDGGVRVEYGEERFELGPGDSMYYNAQVPHRIEAVQHARVLAVLFEAHRP